MQADYEKISEDLNTHGYVICPHFISEAVLEDLRNDLQIRFEEGEFHKAGIGKGEEHQIKQEIRGDCSVVGVLEMAIYSKLCLLFTKPFRHQPLES